MTIYALPSSRAWTPATIEWGVETNGKSNVSGLNGASQDVSLPGSRWTAMLNYPSQPKDERRQLLALLFKVGREHLLQFGDLVQPRPRGTINLTGVTAGAAAQFATSITLNGCGAGKTLLDLDMLSIGGQLFCVAEAATANGAGVMVVEVRHSARSAISSGATVTLDYPTTTWRLVDRNISSSWQPSSGGPIAGPLSVAVVERWT